MQITINNTAVEVQPGETLIEAARRMGFTIPSLCYAKDAKHKSSCMVCAVKNCANGQVIPSCTTVPVEGMVIDTESEEVQQIRTLSLELLLSDHRADCEAPCSMVCSKGLDVESVLAYYDTGRYHDARKLLSQTFALPEVGCEDCKAPCEKACRRGTVDKAVQIRTIIKELAAMEENGSAELVAGEIKPDKKMFLSRLGRFSNKEKEFLKETVDAPSRCLYCACAGRKGCKLRLYATGQGIKRPRYESSSALPVMDKMHIGGSLWFEQAKCIRCGLCVYNSDNGFTFKDRGFGMQVMLPVKNKANVTEQLADLCPTGAIYVRS